LLRNVPEIHKKTDKQWSKLIMVLMTGSDPEKAKNAIPPEKKEKSADKQFGNR
jgi:hypothetical protein